MTPAPGTKELVLPPISSTCTTALIQSLLENSLVLWEDWNALPQARQDAMQRCADPQALLELLQEDRLLTPYQAARISAGKPFGLLLGNYRILARLGSGGMGVVYKGEHIRMRRLVAIKVLSLIGDEDQQLVGRFFSEIRAVARLQHPNIVSAIDVGETRSSQMDAPILYYFVMELIEGQDLESYVMNRGPLPIHLACSLVYQVASALAEAHKNGLVHRDIKPSNIIVTSEEQAKLLDFGLARQLGGDRHTEPGTVLGTIDYLAPEQARDSSTVDIRADIYALGGTLYWCLTGHTPFPALPSMTRELITRLTQSPPTLGSRRPDAPVELEGVISRMMAIAPDDRYPTPQAVMRSLLRFLQREVQYRSAVTGTLGMEAEAARPPSPAMNGACPRTNRVLIVDDEPSIRHLCCVALQGDDILCELASDGEEALAKITTQSFDLVLLDVDMPGIDGFAVSRRLRENPPCPNLKIIMLSGRATIDDMARHLLVAADDFIAKPFSILQLTARIKAALSHKYAQDRSDLLNRHLMAVNAELEQNINTRDSDLIHARNALSLALATLIEQCGTESSSHLARVQRYVRALAEEAIRIPAYAGRIDDNFIQLLECCAPLHDIGKVALPDEILLKPGKLTVEERMQMQEHTTIGANTLQEVARRYGSAVVFLQVAIDICRHHHERFDGTGYPDRLSGDSIPLAARIVAFADVYDALRSRRVYKPALSHTAALQIIVEGSPGQFDPSLVPALQQCAPLWEKIFKEMPE